MRKEILARQYSCDAYLMLFSKSRRNMQTVNYYFPQEPGKPNWGHVSSLIKINRQYDTQRVYAV